MKNYSGKKFIPLMWGAFFTIFIIFAISHFILAFQKLPDLNMAKNNSNTTNENGGVTIKSQIIADGVNIVDSIKDFETKTNIFIENTNKTNKISNLFTGLSYLISAFLAVLSANITQIKENEEML